MACSSYLILIALVLASLFSQNSSFEVGGIIQRIIPTPIQCLFSSKEACNKNNDVEAPIDSIREQGTLSISRDSVRGLIRGIGRKFGEVKRGLGFGVSVSNVTTGLDCNKTLSNGQVDQFKSNIRAIYPGTKWCGDGDMAENFDDLGKFSDTDRCCREHDKCPTTIAADKTNYGLINTGLFTRSHCECDKKFYDCLKDTDSFISKSIGVTYFTILGPQCFMENYPIVACAKQESGKCVEYQVDAKSTKRYQWFDNPTF